MKQRPPKLAAVLILIIGNQGKEQVLLTKRPSHMRTHPGQICFPGGKYESQDRHIVDTAIREAKEEIGLPSCQVLSVLRPSISAHGLCVYPVVAKCLPFQPKINKSEVDSVLYMDLKTFIVPSGRTFVDWDITQSHFYKRSIKNRTIRCHKFPIDDIEFVWGLTSELAIEAAIYYYNHQPNYERHAPDQTMSWTELTTIVFKGKRLI